MQCISGLRVCPDRYFFNGVACEHPRSLNGGCQSDNWCDASKYLICSNWSNTCRCNSSMVWNGTQCIPSEYCIYHFRSYDPNVSVLVCSTGFIGVSLEDLPTSLVIPDGYAGFQWSNLQVCTENHDQRACNRNTSSVSFTRINGTFLLQQVVFGVSAPNITLTFSGIRNGTTHYMSNYLMTGSLFMILRFNWTNIDTFIVNLDGICYYST